MTCLGTVQTVMPAGEFGLCLFVVALSTGSRHSYVR
jgi:hypothetical protein